MANTYLSRTPATVGNQKTFTTSVWVKRATGTIANGDFDSSNYIISYVAQSGSPAPRGAIWLSETGILAWGCNPSGSVWEPESNVQVNGTNVLFRDPSAWYHIVFAVDTTQATESNRLKCWVNGVQYSMSAYPAQNLDTGYNYTHIHNIGRYASGGTGYSSFLMSHFHQIDGTAYDASAFGEFDATTGIWKPKTAPSVTYGTNGFFLKFENSANMDLDSSPNNLTFSTSGNLTQTVDTPSNVFATLNPLWNPNASITLSNGNLTQTVSGDFRSSATTLGASQGKWYAEYKATDVENFSVGITPLSGVFLNTTSNVIGQAGNGWGLIDNWGTVSYYYNTASTNTAITLSNGDIIMIAMDLDNSKVFFGKNGTWLDSGDPANGTNPAFSNVSSDDPIGFAVSCENANGSFNFGNGYFGTTAVSSATTDESGLGIFEYTVPSGYYALCTKNINTQG